MKLVRSFIRAWIPRDKHLLRHKILIMYIYVGTCRYSGPAPKIVVLLVIKCEMSDAFLPN